MSVTFLTNEDEQRFVHKVNGIAPDENGGVSIPTGITKTLLWQNASPLSTFSPQVLEIPTAGYYDEIEACVLAYGTKSSTNGYLVERCTISAQKINGSYPISTSYFQETGTNIYMRPFALISSSQLDVFPTYNMTGPTGVQRNEYMIPIKIYGIKGVQE